MDTTKKWYSVRLTAPDMIDINYLEQFIKIQYPTAFYLMGQHKGDKQEKPHVHLIIDDDVTELKTQHKVFNEWLKINYYGKNKMTSMIYSKWTTDRPKTALKGSVYNTDNAILYILLGTIKNDLLYSTNIDETYISVVLEKVKEMLKEKEPTTIKETIEKQYYNIIYNTVKNNIKKPFDNYVSYKAINICNAHKHHLKYLSIIVLEAIDDEQCINKKFLRFTKLEEIILNGMYIFFREHKDEYPEYFESLKKTRTPRILKEIEFI